MREYVADGKTHDHYRRAVESGVRRDLRATLRIPGRGVVRREPRFLSPIGPEPPFHRLVCVGGENGEPPARLLNWSNGLSDSQAFQVLGSRSATEVGEILAASDVGLAPTPLEVIGKSGAYRAFNAAGLPVLVSTGHVNGHAVKGGLLTAADTDWRLPWDLAERRRLQEQAEAECGWDAIAQTALRHMKTIQRD